MSPSDWKVTKVPGIQRDISESGKQSFRHAVRITSYPEPLRSGTTAEATVPDWFPHLQVLPPAVPKGDTEQVVAIVVELGEGVG